MRGNQPLSTPDKYQYIRISDLNAPAERRMAATGLAAKRAMRQPLPHERRRETMQNFLPWHGLAGSILIGLAAAFYLLVIGRTAGISGILENALAPSSRTFGISLAFLVGLPLGALVVLGLAPGLVPAGTVSGSTGLIVAAGLLVGLGARIGGGCTSGHGVCGLPRLSIRSIVATLTFMATAALTVFIVRHVI
jgi:uncharacterized membrane protein YedE/YeeE